MIHNHDFSNAGKIEKMKNQWGDARISPYRFYIEFYSKYSLHGYSKFLEMINYQERYSPELDRAVKDFQKVYF